MLTRCSVRFVLAIAVLALPCLAGTIVFSNLSGPGDLYGPDGVGIGHTPAFPPISPQFLTYATPFIPSLDSRLLTIELPIGVISGANQASVALLSDIGGQPGAPIEFFLLSNLPTISGPNGFPLVPLNSVLNPLLLAGQKYWISATGGGITFAMWTLTLFQGDPVDGGASRIDPPPQPWIVGTGTRTGALRITADPIPEPASWILGSTGLITLAAFAFRRRKPAI